MHKWFLTYKEADYYSTCTCSSNPRGSQPNLIVLHRHLSATQLICVHCMNGWQSCPKYRAVSDVPFLACNAAATICIHGTIHTMQMTISIDMLHMHEHVCIQKNITPHSVRFFLVSCRKWCAHWQNYDELSWYGGIRITALLLSLNEMIDYVLA